MSIGDQLSCLLLNLPVDQLNDSRKQRVYLLLPLLAQGGEEKETRLIDQACIIVTLAFHTPLHDPTIVD